MSALQDSPRLLELAYRGIYQLLKPLRRWMVPGGWIERVFIEVEQISKGILFDCRMCGQCILHSTGMTCPMTCPKNLRNGPCGGVRIDGRCEVRPDMTCVWLQAWERSKRMPAFGSDILLVQAPVNHKLQNTSAWINDLNPNQDMLPKGW
jgi:Methylene-tetrahydrofolate reductase C terminal